MTYFTRTLFLCLLCVGFFSCIEEVDMTVAPTFEPEEVPVTTAENFKVGSQDVDLTHAYIVTSPVAESGRFNHHIVLSSEDVLDGNDLRSERLLPIVALLLESEDASPVGEYFIRDGSIVDAAGSPWFSVSDGSILLQNLEYDSGSSIIISAEGDGFKIDVDLLHNRSLLGSVNGVFTGPIKTVVPEGQEEIDPEAFTGENFMNRDSELFNLTNAYLVSSQGRFWLYLSDRPVLEENQLTGTSNVMLLMLTEASNGELKTGRYQINSNALPQGGYFFGAARDAIMRSYFCRDMNFDTGRAANDEEVNNGETLVQVDGDTFSVKFNYTTHSNVQVAGEYHGQILEAN